VLQEYTDYHEVARAITDMVIRGAPAIGAAAAFGWLWQLIRQQQRIK